MRRPESCPINEENLSEELCLKKRSSFLESHSYRSHSLAKQGDSVLGSVRPSVSTLTPEPFDLRPGYFVGRLILTLARLGL